MVLVQLYERRSCPKIYFQVCSSVTIPNLAALPLDLLKQVISEIEEMEKADALQSVTRMNHAEMNLNVLIPGGPAPGTMAARAQAAVIDPRGPVLPM